MFSKEDIKPGMLVELSSYGEKELHYVTLCKEGIVLIDKKGNYINFKSFNDDLSGKNAKIKITKVYNLSEYPSISLEFSTENRDILWNIDDETDWSKVEVDTKVLVRDRPNDDWVKRYFAKYVDGKVYVFKEGKTSWNSIGIEHWQETKLYENK